MLNKLYIFSKNTDASASTRGYQYQILKTLEVWLINQIGKIDEEIYCDYEDDIFQKNQSSKTVKFRQLKLYSDNFSFKSEEVEKCICHFFMLHVKTDYQDVDKEFVFEANTRIANSYRDNDAELLRKWVENQDVLPEDVLQECSAKVKYIVSEYISKQSSQLAGDTSQDIIQEALIVFNSLQESHWNEFTKCIKWKFLNLEPEREFSFTIDRISELISKLDFPYSNENPDALFGILYKHVAVKASQQNPEDRKLSKSELEYLILNSGKEEDKWYSEVLEKWKSVGEITDFRIGDFFEILSAIRHCRRNKYLSIHDAFWLTILDFFIHKLPIRNEFKRNAIYEHLWLRFRPDGEYKLPTNDLFGSEDLIRFYFQDFEEFKNASELEDAQSLLHIIFTAMMDKKVNIQFDELKTWFIKLYRILDFRLNATINPNEKCHLLEELGTFTVFIGQRKKAKKQAVNLYHYEKILEIIDTANLYHATTLSDRINKYIKLFIRLDPIGNLVLINALEAFSEKLDVIVKSREGEHNSAKKQIERGVCYIDSKNPTLLLKALDYFHKAKDLWNHQETLEGYVLALLNISRLYNAIDMNLAAKYYALSGAWVSLNSGDQKLHKRISDSFGLMLYSDFKQGSWLSAITDFQLYMFARHELVPTPLDYEEDKTPFESMLDFSILLHATPKISPQFHFLIQSTIQALGYLGQDYIRPAIQLLEKDFPTDDALNELLHNRLSNYPLNDSGKQRTISFHALGSLWKISFENDYKTNSIAEEFCALIQIMLVEIALSDLDLHLLRGTIRIQVEISNQLLQPEQLASNTEFKWKVFLNYFDKIEPNEVNIHASKCTAILLSILLEASLLKDDEFKQLFSRFFREKNLAQKTLSANAYQKMYRLVTSQKEFDKSQRQFFLEVTPMSTFPKENMVIKWKDTLSDKYDQTVAVEYIKNRYRNSKKLIQITLDNLKKDKEFPIFINQLRQEGWLDWQIVVGILNFMVNYKTQHKLNRMTLDSEEEYAKVYLKNFNEFMKSEEKSYYVEFPLEAFKSDDFKFHLGQYPVNILSTYGLENKAKFPNLPAIKEFLDIRFNMKFDTTNEGNPLFEVC